MSATWIVYATTEGGMRQTVTVDAPSAGAAAKRSLGVLSVRPGEPLDLYVLDLATADRFTIEAPEPVVRDRAGDPL